MNKIDAVRVHFAERDISERFVINSVIAGSPLQAPTNPMSASQNKMYTMLSSAVIATAEKMPEESYSFKPAPDVRSFGQLVGHLADSQYFFCSSVGRQNEAKWRRREKQDQQSGTNSGSAEAVAY